MRKDELYDLYSKLKDTEDLILQMLPKMVELKGIDSQLFYNICVKNSNIITEENFYNIFLIFLNICYLENTQSKQEFYAKLNLFLKKDYITCSEDFNFILKTIANLLNYPINEVFENHSDNTDYYKLKIIFYYFELFRRNYYDYDGLYKHDYEEITIQYIDLLTDLQNTEIGPTDDFDTILLNRIELFTKIVNDEKNLSLNPLKYQSIIEVAASINNLPSLLKFKNRVKLLTNDMDNIKFSEILEEYNEELNSNTIDLIYEKLGIEIEECDGIEKFVQKNKPIPELQSEILRRILIPEKQD